MKTYKLYCMVRRRMRRAGNDAERRKLAKELEDCEARWLAYQKEKDLGYTSKGEIDALTPCFEIIKEGDRMERLDPGRAEELIKYMQRKYADPEVEEEEERRLKKLTEIWRAEKTKERLSNLKKNKNKNKKCNSSSSTKISSPKRVKLEEKPKEDIREKLRNYLAEAERRKPKKPSH